MTARFYLALLAAGAAAAQTVCVSVTLTTPAVITPIDCPAPAPNPTDAPVFALTNGGSATFGPAGFVITTLPGQPVGVSLDTSLVPQKFVLPGDPTAAIPGVTSGPGVPGSRTGDRVYDSTAGSNEYKCILPACDAGGFVLVGAGAPGPPGPPGPAGPVGPAGPPPGLVPPPKSNTDPCTPGTWSYDSTKRTFFFCVGGPGQTWLALAAAAF